MHIAASPVGGQGPFKDARLVYPVTSDTYHTVARDPQKHTETLR